MNSTSKNMTFSGHMKLADVIHLDYLLIPIIGRFGIELGFGNKTVKEICIEKNIDLSFFLEIINSYHSKDYFAEDQFAAYPVSLIVKYLRNTHSYYLNVKIPELEEMVEHFFQSSSDQNKPNNKLIANFFDSYKQELVLHLNQEENNLFPYTIQLEKELQQGTGAPDIVAKIRASKAHFTDDDHNHLEEKLYDLKNLIIKFLPPVKRNDILEKLLIELFRLENDLNDHSRIEDKVLIPKVILLENKLLELSDQSIS